MSGFHLLSNEAGDETQPKARSVYEVTWAMTASAVLCMFFLSY